MKRLNKTGGGVVSDGCKQVQILPAGLFGEETLCEQCKKLAEQLVLAKQVIAGMERQQHTWRRNLRNWCKVNVTRASMDDGPDILIDG
jgi:hypothetical protein